MGALGHPSRVGSAVQAEYNSFYSYSKTLMFGNTISFPNRAFTVGFDFKRIAKITATVHVFKKRLQDVLNRVRKSTKVNALVSQLCS